LQNLGYGIEIPVVINDTMQLHPIGDADISPFNDITYSIKILPKFYTKPVSDTFLKSYNTTMRQIVVIPSVFIPEVGKNHCNLSRFWTSLRNI
jgi:hypothetical protein